MKKEPKVRAIFTLDKELVERLDHMCKQLGVSKSSYVQMRLYEALDFMDCLFNPNKTFSESVVELSEKMQNLTTAIESINDNKKEVFENVVKLFKDTDPKQS